MSTFKRCISMLLVLVMVISMVPAQAAATENRTAPEHTSEHVQTPMLPVEVETVSEPESIGPDAAQTASLDFPETPAEDFTLRTMTYYGVEECIAITGYTGTNPNVHIPQTIYGLPVRVIDDSAFQSNTVIQQLIISASVKFISYHAFAYCTSLTQVSLPDGLSTIDNGAFSDCSNLKEIEIPASVSHIGEYAFWECTSLEKVILHEGLQTMAYAFSDCTSLKEIVIPSTVTFCDYAFIDCTALTRATLPEGLESIGPAFLNCTSLVEVEIPSTVKELSRTFSGCSALTQITLPEGLQSMDYAFEGCTSLEEIEIPSTVTNCEHAFSGCTVLTRATLPEGLQSIDHAFERCTSLEEIEIPSTVTMWDQAFSGCTALKRVTISAGPESIGAAFWGCTSLEEIEIPSTVKKLSSTFVSCTALNRVILPEGLESIYYAFRNCTSLEEIEIPSTVTELHSAFEGCTSLARVTLPEELESIQSGTFQNCTSLTEIELPKSVKTIGTYAFESSGLRRLTLPEGLQTIDQYAFQNCANLEEVVLPSTLKTLGNYAFADCTNLEEVVLPSALQTLGHYAFADCTNLKKAVLNAQLQIIGGYSFSGCTALTEVEIPEGIKTIGSGAFFECSALTEVDLPESVTTIASYAFYGCSSLTKIELPKSITMIAGSTFGSCSALTELEIPANVQSIGDYAFERCVKLKGITLPVGLKTIGEGAFKFCACFEEIVIPNTVTSIGEFAFGSCSELSAAIIPESVKSIGNGAFYLCPKLSIYAVPDSYAWNYAVNFRLRVFPISDLKILRMTVLDENGAEVSGGFTVEWYQSESGALLGTGSTLYYNAQETALEYQIVLDEALACRYQQEPRISVTAGTGNQELTHRLQPLSDITVSGVVTDPEGVPIPGASVSVIQTFAERFEKTVTQTTGADGSYRFALKSAPTVITFRAEGYFNRTRTLELGNKTEDLNLGNVEMTPLPADKITLRLTALSPHRPGEDSLPTILAVEPELEYAVRNVTQRRDITEFQVQLPYVMLGEGQAKPGDVIRITATDPLGMYFADAASLTLDSQGTGTAQMLLRQRGCFELTGLDGNRELQYMLFDASGNFVSSGELLPGFVSTPLAAGSYQLVLMEKTGLLRSVSELGNLAAFGMEAGRDYLICNVVIQNDLITQVEAGPIPALSKELFRYVVPEKTSFTANHQTAFYQQIVTLTLKYALDSSYDAVAEAVTIELPKGVSLHQAGIFADNKPTGYAVDGQTLRIPTNAAAGTITLYITADKPGTFFIEANLGIQLDGAQILQPLGTAGVNFTIASMEIPSAVNQSTVSISGKTVANSQVTIYADDEIAGTTRANAAGTWEMEISLRDTYRYSCHRISAEVALPDNGGTYSTADQIIVHASDESMVDTVTMYSTSALGSNTAVFHFQENAPTPAYKLSTGYDNLTFEVRFTDNGEVMPENVCLVFLDQKNDTHRIPCTYSAQKGIWVCCHTLRSPSEAPKSVGVEFDLIDLREEYELDTDYASDLIDYLIGETGEAEDWTMPEPLSTTASEEATLEELNQLMDEMEQQLDELVRNMDESDDLYQSGLDEMGLTVVGEGSASIDLNVMQVDTQVTTISPMTESELLRQGYEKLEITADHVLWKKQENNVVYTIDPMSWTLNMSSCEFDTSALAPMASGEETAAQVLQNIYNIVNSVADFLLFMEEGCIKLEEQLLNKYKFSDALLKRISQEYIDAGQQLNYLESYGNEKEIAAAKGRFFRNGQVLDKAAERVFNASKKLQLIRYAKGLIKKLPIAGLLLNVQEFMSINQNMAILEAQFPITCPDDAAQLSALRSDFNDLKRDFYLKLSADVAINIASLMGLFTAAAAMLPVSGGTSVVTAALIAGGSIAATVAANKVFEDNMRSRQKKLEIAIDELECEKEDEEELPPTNATLPRPITPIVDPSGYVYEAVPSNRIEGVKAEVYYRDGDRDVLWDAENYDQVNPCYTDAAGGFHWDVPFGRWLVKFSKEGYHDTDSRKDPAADEEGYLPVPPPQLEVNTAIVSKAAPTVQSVQAYEDEVLVIFSQYMPLDVLSSGTMTVSCGGRSVSGTITPSNAEWNYEQTIQYASVFRFVPGQKLSGTAEVTIRNVVNYAGTYMTDVYRQSHPIRRRPAHLETDNVQYVVFGKEHQITVQIQPAEAGKALTVTAESNAPALVKVLTPTVTTDENGIAVFTVSGELPGAAELVFRLENTDLTAASEVHVTMTRQDICEKVTASIPNGSAVDEGTVLELFTATEGARIYYTLDGTCPCVEDSPSRIPYTGPIVLTEDTFLIAYAVKEGFQDSPTAGFMYTVKPKPSNPFGDVAPGSFYYESVMWAVKNGITNGTGPSTFAPYEQCLRSQVVTFLWRAMDCPEPTSTRNPFVDVKPSDYYYKAVLWAVENGITNGLDASHFGPFELCDRSQVVTFLYRTMKSPEVSNVKNPFSDVSSHNWFAAPVLWAVENGITNGTTPTTFGPYQVCDRSQIVTFLYRAFQ